MARAAQYSDEMIRDAIRDLEANIGRPPTAFAVRRHLGGGKYDRIQRLLRDHGEVGASHQGMQEPLELPAEFRQAMDEMTTSVTESVTSLVAKLYRHAALVADSRVAEAMKAAKSAQRTAETEIEDARAVLADLDDQVERLQADLAAARDDQKATAGELSEARASIAALTSQRDAAVERATAAERRADEQAAQARQDLHAARSERDAERERRAEAETAQARLEARITRLEEQVTQAGGKQG